MDWINVKDQLPEFNKEIVVGLSVYCFIQNKIICFTYDVGTYCCSGEWKLQYCNDQLKARTGYKTEVQYWSYIPLIDIKGINDGKL
jgi:hypothetical protein